MLADEGNLPLFVPFTCSMHLLTTEGNVIEELGKFIRKYFPKETREKQIELETAAGVEQFGIYYKHPSQRNCLVM